jgi:hypothetical protein
MKTFRHAIGHLVSCKEASHLLSKDQEQPMSWWERVKVGWHLTVCSMCRAFDKQLRFLNEAMRRYRQ